MIDVGSIASRLSLGADGVWQGDEVASSSYPVTGHASCLEVETSSFWFRHCNVCILQISSPIRHVTVSQSSMSAKGMASYRWNWQMQTSKACWLSREAHVPRTGEDAA